MSFLVDTDTCSAYIKGIGRVMNRFLFGEMRAWQLDRGLGSPELDLLNGAVALVHNLTMVTHNFKDYANIPGLMLDDWLVP